MRIQSSNIRLDSSHEAASKTKCRERPRSWVEERSNTNAGLPGPERLSLSKGVRPRGLFRLGDGIRLRGINNQDLEAIARSGIDLHEDGVAGTMQQVDLSV